MIGAWYQRSQQSEPRILGRCLVGALKRELEKVFGLCPVLPDKQERD
jgi:hypothetical protein